MRYTETTCGTRRINDNQWHHIVGVFNAAGKRVDCYIDGIYEGHVTLPQHYQQRFDGAPYIGDTSRVKGTFWTGGSLDDIRVYNYALTAQKVRELYQSYGPEIDSIPTVTIDVTHKDNVRTSQVFTISTQTQINRASKNLLLELKLPNKIQVQDFSVSLLNGESVIDGEIQRSNTLDGIVYRIPLRNDIA